MESSTPRVGLRRDQVRASNRRRKPLELSPPLMMRVVSYVPSPGALHARSAYGAVVGVSMCAIDSGPVSAELLRFRVLASFGRI